MNKNWDGKVAPNMRQRFVVLRDSFRDLKADRYIGGNGFYILLSFLNLKVFFFNVEGFF